MAPTSKYVAVVAIDFGTTYSGFAFSFNDKRGEGGIHMNREWGNEEGRSTLKTPTSILLRPNKEFDSFGYDADDKYVHFTRGEEKEYFYLKHFKMELHKSKELNRTTQLTAANGKKVDALVVFSLSIKFMKDEAVKIIRARTGDENYSANDIQWVLTVPAIWTPSAKQFMREAAYKAGIASPESKEQLIIALEPEGGAIFCRERKMRDFADQTGDASVSDVLGRPGQRYVVMDIGGGTLDVTAHEILDDGNMKEIYQVTGGAYGGIYVDEKFEKLLENLFGIPKVKEYRIKFPAEWLRLMNDFEMKKRGRRAFDDKITRITLPRNFLQMVSERSASDLATCLAKSCNVHDVEIYNDEYLCLGPRAMKGLFDPVVNGIIRHMRELLSKPALKNVSCLFMVGGFAESVILQKAVKTAFSSRCRVLVPNYAGIAVVQGATMFGQKPTIVTSRVMATTYGFDTHHYFDPKTHDPEKKIVAEGIAWCKDIFDIIVKENDVVEVGEKRRFTRMPLYSNQESATFVFFTSTDPNVRYITDSSVGPSIGKVDVDSPDTSKGKKRGIELCIFFGGTEIKVTGIDKTSGNAATVYLDFLTKS
ncbi:heat shock 70 kDa protein 12A-like [Montipora capricornis]|uniref:heat shock 70 kDa protein 12A-like n=1 Tax=Montipora capricornis TaxID=246305 RepID=UPI0035F1B90F